MTLEEALAEVVRLREYVGALEWFAEISGPDALATKNRLAALTQKGNAE